ncbi:hypothetical protein JYU34_012394 [Plutella xylostella]|uniref:Uncharacterized protein n=1 Tax=Plutella xylostella TaxID=51655 RepID=A0ABQ7QEX7_PLUXY|nr:hypothetical protein JYU34_012394 [Plutella xylostella]
MSPRSRKTVTRGKGSCGRFTPRSGNSSAGHCQDLIVESICVITLVIGCIIFSLFYFLTQLSSRSAPSSSMPTRRHRSRIRNIDNHNRSSSESKIQPVSAAGSTRDFEPQNIIRRERSSSFDRRQRVNESSRDSINEELEDFKRSKWKSLMEESFVGKNGQMRYIGMSPSDSLENISEEKIQLQTSSNNPQSSEVNKENMIPKFNVSKEFVPKNESSDNKTSYKDDMELKSKTISEKRKTESLTKHRDLSKDPSQGIISPNRTHKVKTDEQISNNRPGSRRHSNDNNEEVLPDTKDKIRSSKQNDEQKVYNNIKSNSMKLTEEKHNDTEISPKTKLNYSGKNHNDLNIKNDEKMISAEPHVLLDSIKNLQDSEVNLKADGTKSTLTTAHDHKIKIKTTEEDKKYENTSNKSDQAVNPSKKIKIQEHNQNFGTKPVYEVNLKDVISDTHKRQYSNSLKVIPKIGTKMENNGNKSIEKNIHSNDSKPVSSKIEEELNYKNNNGSSKKLHEKVSDELCGCVTTISSQKLSGEVKNLYAKAVDPPFLKLDSTEEKSKKDQVTRTKTLAKIEPKIKEEPVGNSKPNISDDLCGCDDTSNKKQTTDKIHNENQEKSQGYDKTKIKEEPVGNSKPNISDDLCGCVDTSNKKQTTDEIHNENQEKSQGYDKTKIKEEPVGNSKPKISDDLCGCKDTSNKKQTTDEIHNENQEKSQGYDKTKIKEETVGNSKPKISDDLCGCKDTSNKKQTTDQIHNDIREKSQGYDKTKTKEEPVANSKPNISDDLCGCNDTSNKKQTTDQLPSTNNLKEITNDTKTYKTISNEQSKPNHEKVKLEIKQEHLKKSNESNSDDHCGCDVINKLQEPLLQKIVNESSTQFLQHRIKTESNGIKEEKKEIKEEKTHMSAVVPEAHAKKEMETKFLQGTKTDDRNGSSTQFLQHRIKTESNGIKEEKKEIKEEKTHMSAVVPEAHAKKVVDTKTDDSCECDETTDSNNNQLLAPNMYGKSTKVPLLSQIKIEKQEMPSLEEASKPQPIFSKSSKPSFLGVKSEMKEEKYDMKTNLSNIYAKSTTPPFLQSKKEREKTNSSSSNHTYNDLIQKKNFATKESSCNNICGIKSQKSTVSIKKSQSQINAKLSARSINSSHSPKTIRVPFQEMTQYKTSKDRDGRVNKAQFGKNIAKLKAERKRQYSLRQAEKSVSGCSKHCVGVLDQMSKDQLKYFEDHYKGASHQNKIDIEISRSQPHKKNPMEKMQNPSESSIGLLKKMSQQDAHLAETLLDCDRCRSEDMKSLQSNNTNIPLSMTSDETAFVRDIVATSTPNASVSAVPLKETCDKEECKNMKKSVQK